MEPIMNREAALLITLDKDGFKPSKYKPRSLFYEIVLNRKGMGYSDVTRNNQAFYDFRGKKSHAGNE